MEEFPTLKRIIEADDPTIEQEKALWAAQEAAAQRAAEEAEEREAEEEEEDEEEIDGATEDEDEDWWKLHRLISFFHARIMKFTIISTLLI